MGLLQSHVDGPKVTVLPATTFVTGLESKQGTLAMPTIAIMAIITVSTMEETSAEGTNDEVLEGTVGRHVSILAGDIGRGPEASLRISHLSEMDVAVLAYGVDETAVSNADIVQTTADGY